MRIINRQEIEGVYKSSDSKKYKYFINLICDTQKAWGLFESGWALAADRDELQLFPLWPAKEFAQDCAIKEWVSYKAKSISIEDVLKKLIPSVKEKGMNFAIFYTLDNRGIEVSPEELEAHVKEELRKYE